MVTPPNRRTYYQNFKRYFAVDEDRDEEFFLAWEIHAGKQYGALMNRWRAWFNKHGADRKRMGLTAEQWTQWKTWWASAEYKALSKRNSENRLSEVDGPGTGVARHRSGSIPALAHVEKMQKEAGGEKPSSYKVFSAMQIKDGVPLYGRALRIQTAMEQKIAEFVEAGEDYDESEIFDQVNPLSKKQRRVGMGSAVASYISKDSSSSASNQNIDTSTELLESLQRQGEKLGTLAEQLAEKDEIIRKLLETQEAEKVARLAAQEAEKEARLAAQEAEKEARLAMQRDFDQKIANLTSWLAKE